MKLIVGAVAAVVLTAVLGMTLFLQTGDDSPQVPEIEALHMPVDMALIYDNVELRQNLLEGSYVVVHENVVDSRNHCEFCMVIEFRSGLLADAPVVTWSADRQFAIPDAKKVTFYAMGERGGEEVRFLGAGVTLDAENIEFDVTTKPITLDGEWQRFELDLSRADLNGVTNPFGIESVPGQNSVVFVKGLTIEGEPATEPLEVETDGED